MNRIAYKENVISINEDFDRAEYRVLPAGEFAQEELTYEQFYKVLDVLSNDVQKVLPKLKQFDFMNLKLGKDQILDLLHISTGIDIKSLLTFKKSEIKILIDDFFFLNPDLKNELASLCQIAALGMMTTSYVNLEQRLENSLRVSFAEQKKTASSQSQAKTSQSSKPRKK